MKNAILYFPPNKSFMMCKNDNSVRQEAKLKQ